MYAVILSIMAYNMVHLGNAIFAARYAMMDLNNSKAMEILGGK